MKLMITMNYDIVLSNLYIDLIVQNINFYTANNFAISRALVDLYQSSRILDILYCRKNAFLKQKFDNMKLMHVTNAK